MADLSTSGGGPGSVAPLDAGDVAAALAPFGSSRMLPRAAYVDHDLHQWEVQHWFEAGWVCAGRAAIVPGPGSQHAVSVGRIGVLLARDHDGVVRGFANTCRHRGHELVPCDAGVVRGVVQCPYHAWSYELDGRLRLAPRFDDLDAGGRAELGLVPVAIEQWGGWLFVNADSAAPPLADHVGDLTTVLAPWAPDTLVVAAEHRYELRANWKLVHENYHECYHCPLIHPELCVVSSPSSGDNLAATSGAWVGGFMDLEPHAATMALDGRSPVPPLAGLGPVERRRVLYAGLFPNLLISAHPDYVLTHRLRPLAPDRTEVVCQWLFDPSTVAADAFDPAYAVDFWDLTNRQDWAAVESVQRALASPLYRPGVLAPHENAVYQWVAMLARAYGGAPLTPTPLPRPRSR